MVVASIGDQLHNAGTVIALWAPRFLAFLAILVVGYLVAKFVGGLLARVLGRAGLDRTLHGGAGGSYIQRVIPRPSGLVGRIAFWVIFLSAVSLAASVLKVAALTAFIGAVWAYLPNVIAAVVIFLVAGALAAAVAALVTRVMGDTGLGKVVAAAAPILIMTIATFMILVQLQIAKEIVVLTYGLLLGAIALGSALAFGLGGREVAGRMLESAYEAGQANKDQMRRDLDQGMERAREDAQQVKDRVDNGSRQPAGAGRGPATPDPRLGDTATGPATA